MKEWQKETEDGEPKEEPRTTVEHMSSITRFELIYPLTDKSSDEL